MKKFYSIKIQVTTEHENGKIKKHSEEYIAEAVSVTDAEVIITKHFEKMGDFNYEVKSVKETKIVEII